MQCASHHLLDAGVPRRKSLAKAAPDTEARLTRPWHANQMPHGQAQAVVTAP